MIGYLKPHLKKAGKAMKKEYRAVYCGLCHALKGKHGFVGMACLNYEVTLLLLLGAALRDEKPRIFHGACTLSPLIFVPYVDYYTDDFLAAADISLIIADAEAADNLEDDKKFRWKIASKILSHAAKKITLADTSGIRSAIEKYYNSEKSDSIDYSAVIRYCGDLVEALAFPLTNGLPEEERERYLSIANNIGKWVYLVDACDDWAKDQKSGSFNPINLFPADLDPAHLIDLFETLIADDLCSMQIKHYKELTKYLLVDNLKNISSEIIEKYEKERQSHTA